MPVLAMTTFQTNAGQLIAEHLREPLHKAALHAVATRLTRLIGRLKAKENYADQAGRNLYEDVSPALSAQSRKLHFYANCGNITASMRLQHCIA